MSEAEYRHLQDMKDYARRSLRIRMWGTGALAAAGMTALLAMVAAFVWLCCAMSGYHWE